MTGGVEALKTQVSTGPTPLKTQAVLRVAEPLLSAPVTNRVNWTTPRRSSLWVSQVVPRRTGCIQQDVVM
jgi:hypothetical protein